MEQQLFGYGSKEVTSIDVPLLVENWQPTDLECEPRRGGWTMTEQLRHFTRVQYTRDWTAADILSTAKEQLALHAVHDSEIEEVQQALLLDIREEDQRQAMSATLAELR